MYLQFLLYSDALIGVVVSRSSGGGTGGATGALAPLIVKFRGLSPPKMYRVCLVLYPAVQLGIYEATIIICADCS